MTYQPKFTDPRVQKRIANAIQFVEHYIDSTAVPVAKSQMNKHFGQAQTDLARYLKENLLVCTDHYFNWQTHQCKKYVRNQDGLVKLKQQLGIISVPITPKIQDQLNTGDFEYIEKSDRFFNPIQYIPRYVKRPLLAKNGYNYNYDIECASATLLYQRAQRIDRKLILPAIEQYLQDRNQIRNDLSIQYNITVDRIKRMINALFNGATLSISNKTSIFHLLDGNYNLIRQLQADQYLTTLREDIRSMWKTISPDLKIKFNKKRLNSKDKASLYRELEREVMNVIKRELKRTNNKFLLEHDGWTCRDVVDITYVRSCVRSSTGYVINIDWEIYDSI
jgi:hypothetical protein